MKKFIIIIAIIVIYLTYRFFDNNKINYVSISDYSIINTSNYNDYIHKYLIKENRLSSFTSEFINKDVYSIYNDLINNRTIRVNNNDLYFKKVLRESDLVVLNVFMDEIKSNFNKYDYNSNNELFNKIYLNLDKLVNEIRKYALGTIILIGPYNPTNYYDANIDKLYFNMDNKLKKLSNNNSIHYIKMYELRKNNKNNDLINKNIASIIEYYLK